MKFILGVIISIVIGVGIFSCEKKEESTVHCINSMAYESLIFTHYIILPFIENKKHKNTNNDFINDVVLLNKIIINHANTFIDFSGGFFQ